VAAWITVEDVAAALGVDLDTVEDPARLAAVTAAAEAWARRRRQTSGYADTDPPAADVVEGTVTFAVALYRSRGAVDGFASFSTFGGAASLVPTGTMGMVLRLLGIDRPQVG